jgi:hypothetical protein
MRIKQSLLALTVVLALGLAAPRAQAQVVTGGGYVGFGVPGAGGFVSWGTPVVAAAPVVAAPIIPYAAGYPVVVPRPVYARSFYGPAWGYGPRFYGPRPYHYHYAYGRRVW